MFGIELGEMFTLGVVALLIFGPERLPEVAVKAAHFVRKMRSAADSARSELTTSFGGELDDLDLRDLNPRTFVRRHVLDPADEDGVLKSLRSTGNGSSALRAGGAAGTARSSIAAGGGSAGAEAASSAPASAAAVSSGSTAAAPVGAGSVGAAPVGAASGAAVSAAAAAKENGPALPPAMMAPPLAAGDPPPFDLDAT